MISKIILVLAIFCVANASVIMVNVFDDNPETKVGQELQDCNFRACDQLCRRLGFPSGTCINGRCKCDNFLNSDNPESKVGQELQDCNFRACDQLCRRLGFPSGTCINGRCKCDNFLSADNSGTEVAHEQQYYNFQVCDRINGRCKCNIFHNSVPSLINVFSEKAEELNRISSGIKDGSSTIRSCSLVDCNLRCKTQGKTGGFCANNICFCY